jgi:hypothetical protein
LATSGTASAAAVTAMIAAAAIFLSFSRIPASFGAKHSDNKIDWQRSRSTLPRMLLNGVNCGCR